MEVLRVNNEPGHVNPTAYAANAGISIAFDLLAGSTGDRLLLVMGLEAWRL